MLRPALRIGIEKMSANNIVKTVLVEKRSETQTHRGPPLKLRIGFSTVPHQNVCA